MYYTNRNLNGDEESGSVNLGVSGGGTEREGEKLAAGHGTLRRGKRTSIYLRGQDQKRRKYTSRRKQRRGVK